MSAESRKPPQSPHWEAPRGFCRWCGKEVYKAGRRNNRARWHPECVTLYSIANHSVDQRKFLQRRDKGKCAKCGCKSAKWHSDHIFPLHKADYTLPWVDLIEMWLPGNLQTLCADPCHRNKSIQEMRDYHAARKLVSSASPAILSIEI